MGKSSQLYQLEFMWQKTFLRFIKCFCFKSGFA
jgi:hypothetical protein